MTGQEEVILMRLGVSPIAWTNDGIPELGDDIPLEQCLSDASRIGYQGVELGRKFPRRADDLKIVLSSYDLELVTGWHSGRLTERSVDDELKAAEDHLALLTDMGCELVVYGETGRMPDDPSAPLSDRPYLQEKEWPDYAARLSAFARAIQSRLRLAFHPHMFTVVERGSEVYRLMEMTDPIVGLVFDTGHLRLAGVDPLDDLNREAHRVFHVHLKDLRPDVAARCIGKDVSFRQAVLDGVFTVPGDGGIDFEPILRKLNESGYQGWLIVEAEQDPRKANPSDYTRRGYQHVSGILNQRGGGEK